MGIDYYGILQIARNASTKEIQKAYRTLALEFNPERMKQPNAKEVFALIGEAYEVLGDAYKRAIFDQFGEEGLKSGMPLKDKFVPPYHYHGDPMRTYKDFFGTDSPYADLLDYLRFPQEPYDTNTSRAIKLKNPPIRHPLMLTLHEIFFGGVKKKKIHRLAFVDEQKTKTEITEKILSIPIKPGIRADTEIVFYEEGDQSVTHAPADVIFKVEERPHDYFVREGDNLVMSSKIGLEEALLGTTVTVNTIDHRTIRVPITDVIFFGFEKVVENEGMPILEQYPERGNLIIRFDIQFPPYLPKASKDILQRGFQLAKIGGGLKVPETINKLVLADKILRVDPDERAPPI